jgi:putative DNA primase/helicase
VIDLNIDFTLGHDMVIFDKNGQPDAKQIKDVILDKRRVVTIRESETTLYYKDGVYCEGAEQLIKEWTEQLTQGKASVYFVNEVIGHIQRSTYIEREQIRDGSEWICLDNGVLNVHTGEFLPHSPDLIFTMKLPVKYDPSKDCPVIKKFLKDVVGDDQVLLMQQWIGYCLEPEYPFPKGLLGVGGGQNGKTTFMRLLIVFLGEENVSHVAFQSLDPNVNRFAGASLYGKLANIYDDISAREIKDDSVYKIVTGNGYLYVERKFKEAFQMRNRAKMAFSCNQVPPAGDDTSDAYYLRWLLVKFIRTFPIGSHERDEHILEKMTTPDELSGLLNTALAGLKSLLENRKFDGEPTTDEIRKEYDRLSDPGYNFLEEMTYTDFGTEEDGVRSPPAQVVKADLYKRFVGYCKARDIPTISEKKFNQSVRRHRPQVLDKQVACDGQGRIRHWVGLGLNDSTVSDDKQATFALEDVGG